MNTPGVMPASLGRVLVAEDDEDFRKLLALLIRRRGYEVVAAADGTEAIRALEEAPYDVVVTDLCMPGAGGLQILREARLRSPETHVIVATGNASLDTAILAMRDGAGDYFEKCSPLKDLVDRIARGVDHRRELRDWQAARRMLNPLDCSAFLIGQSPAIQSIRLLIDKVAPTDATVLITGETGVGKDVAARAIHALSHLRAKPFVAVNCGAIPDSLLESHLFGHAKGAFTGADSAYDGVFRAAAGGTIFLDEIGDLPLHLQVKLLRAIEQREILPLGTSKPVRIDVRWIASTNRELKKEIALGRFREDLYYRLKVVTAEIPPLRDHREDVPLLVDHYLKLRKNTSGRLHRGVTNATIATLMAAPWPGNVRELEHVLEHAMVLGDGEWIEPHDLPAGLRSAAPKVPSEPSAAAEDLSAAVRRFEKLHIESVLRQVGNDRRAAASKLGIHLATLYRKLQELSIPTAD